MKVYSIEDSGNVVFRYKEMGILKIDLIISNLDSNFNEDDGYTIFLIRILAWHVKYKKRKTLKKDR